MKELICISCFNMKNRGLGPECRLGRILPTKKNQCNKYLARVQDKKHGGPRPGAGRPKLVDKKKVKAFALSSQAIDFISDYSRKNSCSMSAALEHIIDNQSRS